MGQKIVLSDTFTDDTLPKLFDDVGMADGSLFLFKPNHSLGLLTGAPTNGGVILNVARNNAASQLGVSANLLNATSSLVIPQPDDMVIERTARGGVHILPSQTNQGAGTSAAWSVSLPAAVKSRMLSGMTPGASAFFFSMWVMPTRIGITNAANQSVMHAHNANSATSNNAIYCPFGQVSNGNVGSGAFSLSSSGNVGVNGRIYGATSSWKGTKPANANPGVMEAGFGGGNFGAWATYNLNKSPGFVIYCVKVEDLSLNRRANNGAGGTVAEEYLAAVAADLDDFTAAFAVGGQFHGDTITTSPGSFA